MAQIVTAVLAAVLNFTAFGQLKPLCCSFMSFELSHVFLTLQFPGDRLHCRCIQGCLLCHARRRALLEVPKDLTRAFARADNRSGSRRLNVTRNRRSRYQTFQFIPNISMLIEIVGTLTPSSVHGLRALLRYSLHLCPGQHRLLDRFSVLLNLLPVWP